MYCEKNRGSKNRPNDSAFYLAWHYNNSYPHHMILGLSESQDAILSHILVSDYYLIYLFFDRPIFSKHQNIGTVFLPTVSILQPVHLPSTSCPLLRLRHMVMMMMMSANDGEYGLSSAHAIRARGRMVAALPGIVRIWLP